MGANDQQTLKAFLEADAYEGPSLIIAYSHCIAHGIDMRRGLDQQKAAVNSGIWPMYRYNPDLVDEGKNPLVIEPKEPTISVSGLCLQETRYRMLLQADEARAELLMKEATDDASKRWELYKSMAAIEYNSKNPEA